ncbi:MAG: SMI1/KNR4 family protein [Chitinophaga sp.]|uniref:SMI1/KNR4 family protein n=1 Tax=Chitinophaga sp. TaxID=1869181 RepID=UPI0025BFB36C|nr:SMI1/KNR4 family protein [Chitinophaga sp.]MBV8251114.1 SMI1/KNR4 family protein [Chitinophaga sp.]
MNTAFELIIRETASALATTIPLWYAEFLQQQDLRTSRYFSDTTALYGLEELTEMNTAYEIQQYMPGYLLIGSNSGDYGLLINNETTNIYLVELGSLSSDDAAVMALSLEDWQQKNFSSNEEDISAPSPYTIRRNKALQEYALTPDAAWHSSLQQIQQQQKALEQSKASNTITLKEYLSEKQRLLTAMNTLASENNGYLTFMQWWK